MNPSYDYCGACGNKRNNKDNLNAKGWEETMFCAECFIHKIEPEIIDKIKGIDIPELYK